MQWIELLILLVLVFFAWRINENVRRVGHEIYMLRLDEDGEDGEGE
jgi:hypothetical protein